MGDIEQRLKSWSAIGTDLHVLGVAGLVVVVIELLLFQRLSGFTVVLSSVLVLFLPGYAMIVAAFPSRQSLLPSDIAQSAGLEGLFRVAIGFGTSVALSGLLGLAISLAGFPLTRHSVVLVLSSVTFGGLAVAWIRRQRVPNDQRYAPSVGALLQSEYDRTAGKPLTARVLPVIIAVVLLVSVSVVVGAVASPNHGERYTELSVTVPDGSGTSVASEFPNRLIINESQAIDLGVENDEHQSAEYTAVVISQRTEMQDGERVVLETAIHDRISFSLSAGETWTREYTYRPRLVGDDVRVAVLLYRGDAPAETNLRTAYREVYFWTTVRGDEQ
jgi:uncharacterized membrane protein